MEGISLYHYYVQQHLVPIYLHTNPIRHAVFCSFLSNYIKQDAATTAAHGKLIIAFLKECELIWENVSTIWGNIYGCADQYICVTALYLLPIFAHAYNIIIKCAVGEPGHGKYVVEDLNTINIYIYISMLMSNTHLPGSRDYDNHMAVHIITHT